MTDSDPDVRWMSYAEAAKALGVNPESVARRMRRDGWARRRGNDGKPRVAVPVSLLPVPVNVPDSVLVNVPDNAASSTPSVPDLLPNESPDKTAILALTEWAARAEGEAAARREEVERLTLERDAERARLEEADRRIEAERLRAAAAEAKEGELRAERDRLIREWDMAQVGRKVAEDELAAWTTGGPLGRAWRALIYRRGQR